jgi:hypothetical protein
MPTRTVQKSPGARRDNTELIAAMEATIERWDQRQEAAVKVAVEEDPRLEVKRADMLTAFWDAYATPPVVRKKIA